MNYKRVEWIFLIAFFLINSYLLLTLYEGNKDQTVNQAETVEDIETILTNQGIGYPKKLDNHTSTGCYLSAEEVDLSHSEKDLKEQSVKCEGNAINSTLDHPIIFSKHSGNRLLQEFVRQKDHILKGNTYQFLEYFSDNKVRLFSQSYKGIPILDETAELEFYIQNQKVTKYHQQALNNIQPLRDAEKLISEKEVIYTLYMNNKLLKGDNIEWMKLAYTKIYSENHTHVYVPTWLVRIKNTSGLSEIEKVNALTNHLMMNVQGAQGENKK